MRTSFVSLGLTVLVVSLVSGCRTGHGLASRSSDDVNICRQFIAEVGNTMQEPHRESFHPRELTFRQLQILTPVDPDFVEAEFLVLNQEWRFEKDGKRIVIVCGQARVNEQGQRRYFVGYSSGDYGWIDEDVVAKLRSGDYTVLPKVR